MARGKDTSRHPNRQVGRKVLYTRPDGSSREKPTATSTPEEWEDYHQSKAHFEKNKKNTTQPYDPYLNTWA